MMELSDGIKLLSQIANDKDLDAETRKLAKDNIDKIYYIQHLMYERKWRRNDSRNQTE